MSAAGRRVTFALTKRRQGTDGGRSLPDGKRRRRQRAISNALDAADVRRRRGARGDRETAALARGECSRYKRQWRNCRRSSKVERVSGNCEGAGSKVRRPEVWSLTSG